MVEEIARTPWHSKAGPDEAKRPAETIGIFATRATVESGFYPHEIALRAPNTRVVQEACLDLAGMIEAGAPDGIIRPTVERHVDVLLASLDGKTPEKAVLGCTHFPLIEHLFRAALPPETQLLSQPVRVAAALVAYLFRHPEMKDFAPRGYPGTPTEPVCLTTGDADRVTALASRFYGRHLRFQQVESTPTSESATAPADGEMLLNA
jgi:glutamate racemase